MSNCFGRDSGNSPFVSIIPIVPIISTLCAVMGKELDCEGTPGTARIVWCTTHPASETVYMSIVSDTGPWTKVYELLDPPGPLKQCHDVQIPTISIDTTHYFYVVSETATGQVLTSIVYQFCTSGTVLLVNSGLFGGYPNLTKPNLVSFDQIQNGMFSTKVDITHPSQSVLITPFKASIDFTTQTVNEFEQDTEGSFSTTIVSAVVAP